MPLGLAAGRWSGRCSATGSGIPADARVPGALVLVMVPAVLIIANNAVALCGRRSAAVPPARALRTEKSKEEP